MKKNQKTEYIYTEELILNLKNPTKNDLILLFNQKFFKTIMKIEKHTSLNNS